MKRVPIITVLGVILLFANIHCQEKRFTNVRPPAVAGAFYPADPQQLSAQIKSFLQDANAERISGRLYGIIVPHAGYVYSGPVAAFAYKQLQGRDIRRVVVISPSHVEYFSGASVFDGDAYRTPLGDIPVDRAFCDQLAAAGNSIMRSARGHISGGQRGEHALEVQLPFLQTVLKDFKLVPVVMGDQSYETCRTLGLALARLVSDEHTLIVASSDLSHFHPYEEAVTLDRNVLNAVQEWDFFNLSRNLQGRLWEACGGGPIVTLMMAAERLGAREARLLRYANSGDVPEGDRSRVVGYGAFVFTDQRAGGVAEAAPFTVSEEEQRYLLETARKAVCQIVEKDSRFEPAACPFEQLLKNRGAFVTLKKDHYLRGCIGYTAPIEPLYLTVRDVAIQAATRDPRFRPVSGSELDQLTFEVSVLSPFRHVLNTDEIEVGRHGLLVKQGGRTGLLLPQVPVEQNWDRQTFLEQTCRKAGLPPDAWQDDQTDIFSFTAFVFGEEEAR